MLGIFGIYYIVNENFVLYQKYHIHNRDNYLSIYAISELLHVHVIHVSGSTRTCIDCRIRRECSV